MKAGIPDFPDIDTFYQQSVDIWSATGSFPPGGSARVSGVVVLMTETFGAGSRGRTSSKLNYTHIILVDPTIEVRDAYQGNNVSTSQLDWIALPTGTTNNTWLSVVLGFNTMLPGLGKKKVLLCDRYSSDTRSGGGTRTPWF